MWRLLQADKVLHADWRFRSRAWFNLVRYRRVVEAIVQSAAIYSTASIALVVTSFLSPNIGYVACLSVFPQLIVRSCFTGASFWTELIPDTDGPAITLQGVVFTLIVIQIARKSALSNFVNNQSPEWQDVRVVGAVINEKGRTQTMDLEMHTSAMTGSDGAGILGIEREAAQYNPSAEPTSTEGMS